MLGKSFMMMAILWGMVAFGKRYGLNDWLTALAITFDEQCQAAPLEDKMRICQRSYRPPVEDIIFECHILAIATGLSEHTE